MDKGPEFASLSETSHELEIAQARDYYVVQHNDLVQKQRFSLDKNAGNSLTVMEEKVLAYLISQIKPDAKTLEPLTFDIKTFCEVCGLTATGDNNYYGRLKSTIGKLAGRVMWLTDRQQGIETTVRYIDRAMIQKGTGKVKIRLDDMLGPYLLNLAGNYFQFSYHNILAMKSKYGIQLYKLLKSYYYNFPRIKFSLDDLKMNLDAARYENFTNFKKKVIEPALKDINTYSDLQVTAEFVKTGRTFTDVIFTMKDLEKPKTPEALEEAQRRYSNVEREIDPDQLTLDGYLGGLWL